MSGPTITPPNFQRSWLPAGTRLNNTYEIDRPIATGGMGEIYQGHEIGTNHTVAIKLMLPEFAENESALALFGREASALRQLQHEAIVHYYIFAVEQVLQRPFLAMEFVEGRSLSAILDDDGPLGSEAAHALLKRIANGLQAAHEHGIIHRDVSPDNIIVPRGDVTRAKLIDFGIARLTEAQEGTVIGSGFAGKHNYVSPEQLGLAGGNVTAKSDIYSLGLVMVQALTGRALNMGGTQVEIIEKRRRVPDLSAVDMRFRPLLERMLQPQPDRRPDSMAAVADWQLGSTGVPRSSKSSETRRSTSISASAAKSGGRGPRYAAMTLLVLALLGGATGGMLYYDPDLMNQLRQWNPFARPGQVDTNTQPQVPPVVPGLEPVPQPPRPPQPPQPPQQRPPVVVPPDSGNRPTTNPPPVNRETNADKIRRYIEQYDGGDCFFANATAVRPPFVEIDGFGSATNAFNKFADTFMRDNGIDPDIHMRMVTQAQCPAINFLHRLKGERVRPPKIELDSFSVRSGDRLTGLVSGFANRNIELLLIFDDGIVQNVSNLLKPGTDAKTFEIGMGRRQGPTGPQPQLLLAIASERPIPALRPAGQVAADAFFSALNDEARAGQMITATVVLFYLER